MYEKKNISIELEGSVNTAFYLENVQLNISVNSQLPIFWDKRNSG